MDEPIPIAGAMPEPEREVVFELYHERSKQRRHDLEFNRRIHMVNNNLELHRVIARTFKAYPGAALTPLPPVTPADGTSFERVAALRRSIRHFTGAPLALADLARLTYFAAGITGRLDASLDETPQPVRAAPSGGALYPVELYVVVTAVESLEPGLYHYAPDLHALELMRHGALANVLSEATSDPATFSPAAVAFVLTALFGRSQFKYGERAYRFAVLEAGHVCQNLLLTATALELGAVAVGGFVDSEVNELLDLDGVEEAAIYLVAAGHPAARPPSRERAMEAIVGHLLGTIRGDVPPSGPHQV